MCRIGYLIRDGFQIVGLATQAVFEWTNIVAGEPFYALEDFSVEGGEMRSSLGLKLTTRPLASVSTWTRGSLAGSAIR
jgi:hypothetical protein